MSNAVWSKRGEEVKSGEGCGEVLWMWKGGTQEVRVS